MSSNVSPTFANITPEGLGIVVSRLAQRLGVERREVAVIHWAGNPGVLELWTAPWGPHYPETHLGSFAPDFSAEDPYVLPPQEEWTR